MKPKSVAEEEKSEPRVASSSSLWKRTNERGLLIGSEKVDEEKLFFGREVVLGFLQIFRRGEA